MSEAEGAFSPRSGAPGPSPHQASPVRLSSSSRGAAASQQGPASCCLPGLCSGPSPAGSSFPWSGSWRNSWSPLACVPATGPWGELLPSLSARPGGGCPWSWLPLEHLSSGFQEPLNFHFLRWRPGRWSQAACFTALPRRPWTRLLEDLVWPSPCSPCLGLPATQGGPAPWQGAPSDGNLEHVSALACTRGDMEASGSGVEGAG